MGAAWNEIATCLVLWAGYSPQLVETTPVWPQGLLDAYIAMIPKVDGDSTPLGQRPLCVLPVVYRTLGLPQARSSQGLGSGMDPSVYLLSWERGVVS